MVLGAFSYMGTMELQVVQGRQNDHHCSLKKLVRVENAIPTSRSQKTFFQTNSIRLLDHPPRSPDLSPIANLWGWMVRNVHKDGTQLETAGVGVALRQALFTSGRNIWDTVTQTPVSRVPQRICEVTDNNCDSTDY